MLKLHYAPNTISIVVAIALNEGGVHSEPIRVDFASAEQTKPAYKAINPKARVPALVTPGGILTETGAIIEYLADTAVPALRPADPFQAAKMREMVFYVATTMHVNHAHRMRGYRWADQQSSYDDMAAKVPETMAESCAYVESQIEGPLLFGEHVTLADIYLFVVSHWLKGDGVDVTNYPKLTAFREAMLARPSVQKALAEGMLT